MSISKVTDTVPERAGVHQILLAKVKRCQTTPSIPVPLRSNRLEVPTCFGYELHSGAQRSRYGLERQCRLADSGQVKYRIVEQDR